MKKRLTTKLFTLLSITALSALLLPHISFAQNGGGLVADGFIFVVDQILYVLGSAFQTICSYTVVVGGLALNVAISLTLQISKIVAGVPGINVVWTVLRDFSSIFFIFILLYVSIATIVGKGDSSSVKKLVVSIVFAGLFINFSLFITKTIIDATNVVAIGIYDAIIPDRTAEVSLGSSAGLDGGLSDVFMNGMKLPSVYKGITKDKLANPITFFVQAAVSGIIMVVAGIVFAAGAVLMLLRTIQLIIFLAISPLFAFSFIKIPVLSDHLGSEGGKYWKQFISQATFAPIFLAIIYIALKILEPSANATESEIAHIANTISASSGATSALASQQAVSTFGSFLANPGQSAIGILINYFILLSLFLAALKAAKDSGIEGAKAVTSWAEKGTGWAQDKLNPWSMAKAGAYQMGGRWAVEKFGKSVEATDKKWGNTALGNSRTGRAFRAMTTQAIQGSTLGKLAESESKTSKDIAKKGIELSNEAALGESLKKFNKDSAESKNDLADKLNKMSPAEIQNIGVKDILKENKEKGETIAAMLPQSYYDAVEKKLQAGEVKQEDYDKLIGARHNGFVKALGEKEHMDSKTKSNFTKLDTEDLMAIHEASAGKGNEENIDKSALMGTEAANILTGSQIKKLQENNTNVKLTTALAKKILSEHKAGKGPSAGAYINKNRKDFNLP
ncbi:MAG: hypothetical protein NTV72_00310 [Candidatus Taylorbacteria bacterium]|nr:hypothetical protein [Candidatus Taylorbacteria bacterium]